MSYSERTGTHVVPGGWGGEGATTEVVPGYFEFVQHYTLPDMFC